MHVKAKRITFCGVLLALTILCMVLGSVIETSTLFLLAAASYFVGIVFREFGGTYGGAFYSAGVLLGSFTAPNKLYVASYAAMGLYILAVEILWELLENRKKLAQERRQEREIYREAEAFSPADETRSICGNENADISFGDDAVDMKRRRADFRKRQAAYMGLKYAVFNLLYFPAVFLFQELLFGKRLSAVLLAAVIGAGQIGLFLYDSAYRYVQRELWGKWRRRFLF